MAIVYRHRRNDSNQVFYIGIGKEEKRAYSNKSRNTHWKGIVNKHGYSVEIIANDLSWEEACELEIFLISEYGRNDLGLGPLVNMTDGGEGIINQVISDETRLKISECKKGVKRSDEVKQRISELSKLKKNFLGKTHSDETKQKIAEKSKGRKIPGKLVLNLETGIFYETTREASDTTNISATYFRQMMNGGYKNKTSFVRI